MYFTDNIFKYHIPVTIFFILILFSSSACSKTFKGKVIDAETKEPIAGAVVVTSWHEARATIAGEDTRLKDVKETHTNKTGEWMVKGPKGSWGGNLTAIFTLLTYTFYTRPPQFVIFKPGYCSWPRGFRIEACQGKIKPAGNDKVAIGEIIELPKLIKKEDRLMVIPGPITGFLEGEDAWEKQKEFIRLINDERKVLGLKKSYY